jgi:hypothetical protein
MNELFIRLRNFRNGPVTYSVHGIHFNVGVWAKIPEAIKVGNDTFELAEYLRSLRSDDDTQALFEVTDLAGAKGIEAAERARAEREALAARPTPGSLSLVDRATTPAGTVAAPSLEEPLRGRKYLNPSQEHVDGEEIISQEEKEAAEAAAAEKAEKETEDTAGDATDATPASSRRAARSARQQAKADSK